jgi:hypothetical protein
MVIVRRYRFEPCDDALGLQIGFHMAGTVYETVVNAQAI